jgi:hypothetical protein
MFMFPRISPELLTSHPVTPKMKAIARLEFTI